MSRNREIHSVIRVSRAWAAVLVACAIGMPQSAKAEYTLLEKGGFKAGFGFKASAYALGAWDANYGLGRIDLVTGEDTGQTVDSYEFYFEPVLNMIYDMGEVGTVYGAVSGVAEFSEGDGDPIGYTAGDISRVDHEYGYVGWRGETIDFSVGAQDFVVGDQFLIGDGALDAVDHLYWSAPHTAFRNSAIVRVNGDPVRADLFWLKAAGNEVNTVNGQFDFSQGDTEVAGLNVEYLLGEEGANGKLGAMYLSVFDQNALNSVAVVFSQRKGREIFDIRANGVKVAALPNFTFHGEYAQTFGEGEGHLRGIEYDSYAWYLEGEYNFATLPWTPTLAYRYGFWSGDPDLTDSTDETFDSLFFYFGRGWGTWYQGEINGEYLLFNRNQKVHMVKLTAVPAEKWAIGGLFFYQTFDEKNYLGIPGTEITSRDWGPEVNIYAEWYPTENVYVVLLGAMAFPGQAAKEIYGDQDYSLIEAQVLFTF
ncbi:MAG: alginate export family protein [Chromatiales bacterium]